MADKGVAIAAIAGLGALVYAVKANASANAPTPKPKPPPVPRPQPKPAAPMSDKQASVPLMQLAEAFAADLRAHGRQYDRALCAAFQARSGLDNDGVYGAQTSAALRKWVPSAPGALVATKANADPAKLAVAKLGPITQIKTGADGAAVRNTDWTNVPPGEDDEWDEDPWTGDELLTDEQRGALQDADEQAERLNQDSSVDQLERARLAAEKAKAMMSPRSVPAIPLMPNPPNDMIDADDEDEGDARAAPLSAPTPIDLEKARKEAPALAKHIAAKKKNYTRQSVIAFQKHAGLVPDGFYGPITQSALSYFGVKNPPAALYKASPGSPTVYAPAT